MGTLLHACAHFKQLCACSSGIEPCASVWSKVVVDQWSTKALKAECKRLGIAVSGKKSDLVGRIKKQRVVAKKNKKMMEKMGVKKNKTVAEQLMKTPIKHTKPQQKKKNATPSSHQHTIQRFFKSVKKKKDNRSSPAMRTLFGSRRTGRKARELQSSSSSSSGNNVNFEEDDDGGYEEEEEEEQDNDDDSDFDIDCVSLPSDDSETESDIE